VRCQPSKSSPIGTYEPEVGSPFVFFKVRFAQHESNPLAVRRNLRVGKSIHRQHIVDGKRMSLIETGGKTRTGHHKQKK